MRGILPHDVGLSCKQPEENATQLAERYEQQAVNMLGNAIRLGIPNGLSVDGADAFFKSMATSMDEAMGGRRINIGVICERYSAFCKKLGNNPAARVNELLAGKRCSGSCK